MGSVQEPLRSNNIKPIEHKPTDAPVKVKSTETKPDTTIPIINNPKTTPKIHNLSSPEIENLTKQPKIQNQPVLKQSKFSADNFFKAISAKTNLSSDEKNFLKTTGKILAIAGGGTLALAASGFINLPAIEVLSILSTELLSGLGGSIKGATVGALEGFKLGGEILPEVLGEYGISIVLGKMLGSLAGGIYGFGSGLINAVVNTK